MAAGDSSCGLLTVTKSSCWQLSSGFQNLPARSCKENCTEIIFQTVLWSTLVLFWDKVCYPCGSACRLSFSRFFSAGIFAVVLFKTFFLKAKNLNRSIKKVTSRELSGVMLWYCCWCTVYNNSSLWGGVCKVQKQNRSVHLDTSEKDRLLWILKFVLVALRALLVHV